jgi:hypothetical protein
MDLKKIPMMHIKCRFSKQVSIFNSFRAFQSQLNSHVNCDRYMWNNEQKGQDWEGGPRMRHEHTHIYEKEKRERMVSKITFFHEE